MKWAELKEVIDNHPDVNEDTGIDWIDIGSGDVGPESIYVNEYNCLEVSE